jgi:hypothetical protein
MVVADLVYALMMLPRQSVVDNCVGLVKLEGIPKPR